MARRLCGEDNYPPPLLAVARLGLPGTCRTFPRPGLDRRYDKGITLVSDLTVRALSRANRLLHSCYHAALGNWLLRLGSLRDVAEMPPPTTVRKNQGGKGVRTTRGNAARVLGVEDTVIESVDLEHDERGKELLVARVRVKAGGARRCCPGYDTSATPRRWRGLGLGSTQVFCR